MRNWIFWIPFQLGTLALCAGCTARDTTGPLPPIAQNALKVGLVLDKGGRDDKSFNTAAYVGAQRAVKAFGIALKYVESPNDAAFEPSLRTFSERAYPLTIAIGFSQRDALARVAKQFPKLHYAIVDGTMDLPNVECLLFADHEGSFLVGYAAGLATQSGKIGFIGGMDIPLIRRFQMGFAAGVVAARKDLKLEPATLLATFIGNTSEAWNNPARAKELALGQYEAGADIIFAPAGASAKGVFDGAEEKNKFAIGVDSNQNGEKPGRILTSMVKRVDEAVYTAIAEEKNAKFKAGIRTFGLKDRGIDYAVDENNAKLIAPFKAQLEKERLAIIEGRVKVPDYFIEEKIRN